MTLDRTADRDYLRTVAYADSTKLRSRASIYQWREPRGAIGPWVLALVDWPAGRALDVGCGPGSYLSLVRASLPQVSITGADLSPGMAREASAHAPTVVGDAARLPFADATFTRVLAPHMLYHCPDLEATAAELRRVVGDDGGVVLVVTNGADHLLELADLNEAVTGHRVDVSTDRFNLDNGEAVLRTAFGDVEVAHYEGAVAVPDVDALVAYVASMQHFADIDDGAAIVGELRARFADVIERNGAFRARTHSGAFVCRA